MLLFSEYPDKSHNFTNWYLNLTIHHFLLFLRIYNWSVRQPQRQSVRSIASCYLSKIFHLTSCTNYAVTHSLFVSWHVFDAICCAIRFCHVANKKGMNRMKRLKYKQNQLSSFDRGFSVFYSPAVHRNIHVTNIHRKLRTFILLPWRLFIAKEKVIAKFTLIIIEDFIC